MNILKIKAWNGNKFYNPIINDGSVYRNDRDFEDAIDYTDQVVFYSGIDDEAGNEIYEHDMVTRISMAPGGKDFTGEVIFDEGCFWIDNGTEAVLLFTEIDKLIKTGNSFEEGK